MKSPPSHDIGHYRVETRIGEGGMGVVYRALDTKLHRPVAIKFLSDELADAAARRRFQREAQTASSLNHPHIVTVYDVGEIGGRQYLVTEYIDGGTLRDWARRQKRSWRDIVELLKGVADGLATAHEANILHRDIKPANILITKSGYAKVADFGLATLAEDADANVTPTLTEDATARGAVIGTIAYMSPEQAVGQKLDARSDVFSFGAVLYELLGGKRPFEGSTDLELLQNVIKAEPPPLADDVSLRLRMVVEKALAKNPAERYQSMRELAVDLRRLLHQSAEQPGIVIPPRPRGRWWPWAAAAFLLAVAYVFVQTRGTTEVPEPLTAAAFTSLPGLERYPSFSPDGDRVAFMWTGTTQDNPDIYVQQVGAGGHVQLTFDPRSDFNPAWSPDGRWIAFLRGDTPALQMRGRFEVRLIPPLGGRDIKLAEIRVQMNYLSPVSNLTWCADSTCVIVTHSQREGDADALFVVPLDGGEMTQLTNPPPSIAGGDNDASMSPDGALLVFRRTGNVPVGELYLQPLETGAKAKGEPHGLGPGRYPAWMPDSREILFAAPGGFWRLSATEDTAKPSRLPFVGDDGMMPAVSRPRPGMEPRLVYARRLEDYNIWRVVIPRPGAPSAPARFDAISSTRSDKVPNPSPDGSRIAFVSNRSGSDQVWLADANGTNAVQLTTGSNTNFTPNWSPDSQQITFTNPGQSAIYVVPAAGGKPSLLASQANGSTFSPDGQWIYFVSNRASPSQIMKVPASGGAPVVQVSNVVVFASSVKPSPDGFLYWAETGSGPGAVWRAPSEGGQPVKVIEQVLDGTFCLADKGIYYVDRAAGETRLQYLDLATNITSTVARNLGELWTGLGISPNGQTVYYSRLDTTSDDLMLVENFR